MSGPAHAKIVVYPGSFDPITQGHSDVAARAARLFDEVILAIAADAEKDHLFSLEERLAMAQDAVAAFANVRVECFRGLVVDYARSRGAAALVKGLRSSADFDRESQMAGMNDHLAPGLETVFLLSDPGLGFLSSSLLKHVFRLGGDVAPFVTPLVLEHLQERLGSG